MERLLLEVGLMVALSLFESQGKDTEPLKKAYLKAPATMCYSMVVGDLKYTKCRNDKYGEYETWAPL